MGYRSDGGQRPQERQPAGPVLARGHIQAEEFPAAVGVFSQINRTHRAFPARRQWI
jgi:hypothetical protein